MQPGISQNKPTARSIAVAAGRPLSLSGEGLISSAVVEHQSFFPVPGAPIAISTGAPSITDLLLPPATIGRVGSDIFLTHRSFAFLPSSDRDLALEAVELARAKQYPDLEILPKRVAKSYSPSGSEPHELLRRMCLGVFHSLRQSDPVRALQFGQRAYDHSTSVQAPPVSELSSLTEHLAITALHADQIPIGIEFARAFVEFAEPQGPKLHGRAKVVLATCLIGANEAREASTILDSVQADLSTLQPDAVIRFWNARSRTAERILDHEAAETASVQVIALTANQPRRWVDLRCEQYLRFARNALSSALDEVDDEGVSACYSLAGGWLERAQTEAESHNSSLSTRYEVICACRDFYCDAQPQYDRAVLFAHTAVNLATALAGVGSDLVAREVGNLADVLLTGGRHMRERAELEFLNAANTIIPFTADPGLVAQLLYDAGSCAPPDRRVDYARQSLDFLSARFANDAERVAQAQITLAAALISLHLAVPLSPPLQRAALLSEADTLTREALATARAAHRKFPTSAITKSDFARALTRRGVLFCRQSKYDAAINVLDEAAKILPHGLEQHEHGELLVHRAWAHLALAEHNPTPEMVQRAASAITAIGEVCPQVQADAHPQMCRVVARLFGRLGDLAQSWEFIKLAERLENRDDSGEDFQGTHAPT